MKNNLFFIQNCISIYVLFKITLLCFIFLSTSASQMLFAQKVLEKREKYLLLDNRIIDHTENAKLVVGTVKKHPANPLFVEDKPWEKRFDNLYGNVIYDEKEKIYKLWYSPFIKDNSASGMSLDERNATKYKAPKFREMGICYAISKDGIKWEKPNLGLVEFEGNKNNNIVWRGKVEKGRYWKGPHGSGIFYDDHETDPNKKYKIIFKEEKLTVGFSKDGLIWDTYYPCKGEVTVAGDTHNNAFWAPTLGKYVGITRTWSKPSPEAAPLRVVARIESDDYENWTKEEVVLKGTDASLHPYAMPVFYYEGVYLGLIAEFNTKSDKVWTELAWSADTKTWQRISPGVPLIPNSMTKLDYDYGCIYTCANPIITKDEIKIYYGGSDYLHFGWRNGSLNLATMRPDGFAGYEQKIEQRPAVVQTNRIVKSGENILITADVENGGSLIVKVLNSEGKLLATSRKISKSITDEELKFDKKWDNEIIRLQFEFSKSKIYSFGTK